MCNDAFFCGMFCFCLLAHCPNLRAQTSTESDSIELLIRLLTDDDVEKRDHACHKLAELGPKAGNAIPALAELVQKAARGSSREYALGALYHIGDAAVPALMMLLDHPKGDVRKGVFETLKLMGPVAHSAVPALAERLKHKDSERRRQALEILAAIGVKAEPAIPRLANLLENNEHGVYALGALTKIGVASIPALISTMSSSKNGDARRWAAVGLGEIGMPGKETAIPALIKGLSDREPSVRAYSAKSLANFGRHAERAVEMLVKTLGDEDHYTRKFSSLALGTIGVGTRAAKAALTKALSSEENDVQLSAAWALSQIGPGAESIPALVDAVRNGHPWTATHAVRALVRIGPEARNALVQEVVPALINDVSKDETFARSQAMKSLMEIGPDAKAAIDAVRSVLKNGKPFEKLAAIGVLGEIGPDARKSVPDLIELVKKEIDEDQGAADYKEACVTRNEAAWALAVQRYEIVAKGR